MDYNVRRKKLDNLFSYDRTNHQSDGCRHNYMNSVFSANNNYSYKPSSTEKSMNTITNIMTGIAVTTAAVGLGSSIVSLFSNIKEAKKSNSNNNTPGTGAGDPAASAQGLDEAVNQAVQTDNWDAVKAQIRTSKSTHSATERVIANYGVQIQKAQADLNITTGIIDQASAENADIDNVQKPQALQEKTTAFETADTEFTATEASINGKIEGLQQGINALQGTPGSESVIAKLNSGIQLYRQQLQVAEARRDEAKRTAEEAYNIKIEELDIRKGQNDQKIQEYTPIKNTQSQRLERLETEKTSLTTNNQTLAQKITLAESRLQQYGRN